MEFVKCPACGSVVQGRLEYIDVTFLCASCCMRRINCDDETSSYGCFYSVSESYAKFCGVSASDLARLKHLTLVEKTTEGPKPFRMYLRGEVRFLRNLRRKQSLEPKLGISLKRLNPLVRHSLLGDYLTQLTEGATQLEHVQKRRCVVTRVRKILKTCKRARPDAAFDFCIEHPGAGPSTFQDLKEKMQQVFKLEGRRILHNLPKNELAKLKEGPLADVYTDFQRHESDALVRSYLKNWFTEGTIDEIMADFGWRVHLWATGPEDRTAFKLKEFWNQKMQRKAKLIDALQEKHLVFSESCDFCVNYLNDHDVLELEEIVAIVELKERLKKNGIYPGSRRAFFAIDELIHCMDDLKYPHYRAVRVGYEAAFDYIESESEDDNSENEMLDESDFEDEDEA